MVLDPVSDQVTIVNAGHMPPLVRDTNTKDINEPGEEECGLPIAIAEGMDDESNTRRKPLHALRNCDR